MKKTILFLFVIVTACNACAQNAKEIAAALLQHYTELSDGSYMQLNKQKLGSGDTYTQYEEPNNIIEANKTQIAYYGGGLESTLTFYRNNPLAVKTGKEIIKAMKIIGDKEGFTFTRISDDTYNLYKGAEEIMGYSHEFYVNIYPTEYLHFYIYANPPYSRYLADEKSYNGHYPTKITKSKQPQVVQLADGVSSHAVIMNGIFEDGKLTQGSIELSGFDNFRNGTWYSRYWSYNFARVAFLPQGTTDTILGYVKNLSFLYFEPDNSLYYAYNKKNNNVLKSTIPWLKNVYEQRGANRPNNEDYIYTNATTLADVTFKAEAKQHNAGLPDEAVKILENGDTYIGGFASNLPEGEGTLTTKAGNTYTGRWKQGVPVGEFKIHYLPKDDLLVSDYVGTVNKDFQLEGRGVYTTPVITVSGNFQNGVLNGKGSKTWIKDGAVETGQYLNGWRNGVIDYSDNEMTASYTYVNGVLNGPAKIHYKENGNSSYGNYVNNKSDGKWVIYNTATGYHHESMFVDGELQLSEDAPYTAPVKNNGSNNRPPANGNSNRITERNCPRCNGSGRVISTDNGGYQTKVSCGLCGGTGKVH